MTFFRVLFLAFLGLLPALALAQAIPANPSTGVANLQVQLNELQEQMREMRGLIEESQHKSAQTQRDLKSLSEDIDFRLQALEQKTSAIPAATVEAPASATEVAPGGEATAGASLSPTASPPTAPTPGGTSPGSPAKGSSAKEQYDQAFQLMSQAKYEEAGQQWEAFAQAHPKDPLIGNAYYWLGESYYVRGNYLKAADNFRQGFEKMPEGSKAPDNLYKLAVSLNMLNKKKEACIVLKQIGIKYQGQKTPVLQKAATKGKELGCTK